MTRPDDAMERVLEGLRDVEAPVGMERRILDRLESTAEERGRVSWRPLWLMGMARPGVAVWCGVGAAALIACVFGILGISVVHRMGHAPAGAKLNLTGMGMTGQEKPEETALRAVMPVAKPGGSIERFAVRNGAMKERSAASVESDVDSVAMSEMNAASFPAPPMPLTEQEKLILRMVHRGDGVELAMLDPKMEALRDAEEKEEFRKFFARPVVKESGVDGSGQKEMAETQSAAEATAGSTEQQVEKSPTAETEPTKNEGIPQQAVTGERQ